MVVIKGCWIKDEKNYKLQNTNYKQITKYNVQNYKPNLINAISPKTPFPQPPIPPTPQPPIPPNRPTQVAGTRGSA